MTDKVDIIKVFENYKMNKETKITLTISELVQFSDLYISKYFSKKKKEIELTDIKKDYESFLKIKKSNV